MILESWIGPAGIMVVITVFGGGVQLYVNIVQLNRRQARMEDDIRETARQLVGVSQTCERTALLLDRIQQDLNKTDHSLEQNNNQTAELRRRASILEERLSRKD